MTTSLALPSRRNLAQALEKLVNISPARVGPVEVISKRNTPKEMSLKLKDYFKAGVKLVWYIYPVDQCAEVYTSPSSKKTLKKDDYLEGGKVLPGFRLQLNKLFVRTKPRSKGRGQ